MNRYTQWSQPCSRPPPTHTPLETPGHSQASLGQSLVGSLLLSPGSWCTRFSLCPPRVYFPVLCKFWWLYGGVNGDLLQEGLCHTQVCCPQRPCPCGRPLLTRTSTGDVQTLFCLSLCGVSGSWCAQGLFEPSESLWQGWGLILNANSLPYHLAEALCLWTWGMSSQPLQCDTAATPVPPILLGLLSYAQYFVITYKEKESKKSHILNSITKLYSVIYIHNPISLLYP